MDVKNKNMIFQDENGINYNVEPLFEFKVDALNKTFAVYSLCDENPDNPNGDIMIGELVTDQNGIDIIGVKEEEKEIVEQLYIDIVSKIGGE